MAAERLCEFPHIGRIGEAAGTRQWVVRGAFYIIVYEADEAHDAIIVIGVFHGAQDWHERVK